jgi:hypothetical protein
LHGAHNRFNQLLDLRNSIGYRKWNGLILSVDVVQQFQGRHGLQTVVKAIAFGGQHRGILFKGIFSEMAQRTSTNNFLQMNR